MGKSIVLLVAAVLAISSFLAEQAHADYTVTISVAASANGGWSGGTPDVWTPGGPGSNVSVADIQSRLGGKGVTISTAGGGEESGDIIVDSAVAWSADALTLNAARDIDINAVMTASGTSSFVMTTGTGTVRAGFAPGEANGFAGRVDFLQADGTTPRSGTGFLTINGTGYTVIGSLGAEGSSTGADLQGIGGVLDGKYALGTNIDASGTSRWHGGEGFYPIGDSDTGFSGVFDGLGHTISSLSINRASTTMVGLFGYTISGAYLRNVGLEGGSVRGDSIVGGVVGFNTATSVANAYAACSVQGNYEVGGLAGYSSSPLKSVYAAGSVTGTDIIGGLVGYSDSPISNSYAIGSVTGNTEIGGLIGRNCNTVSNSYATGGVPGNLILGGLTGSNQDTISNSYATGSVSGNDYVGGLVGSNSFPSSLVSDSYSAGYVSGGDMSGGLVGANAGIVSNSFWNTETSLKSSSAGGTGLTTSNMKLLTNFTAAGWDIDDSGGSGKVWRIYSTNTYPLLRSFLGPLTVTANDDAMLYDGSTSYSGGNGVVYSPEDYDPSLVLGTIGYSGTSQGAVGIGTYAITPAGLYSCQYGYDINLFDGTLNITSTARTLTAEKGGTGTGTVTSNPGGITCGGDCQAVYVSNTSVTLTATADTGSTVSWTSGCDSTGGSSQEATCTIDLASDSIVTAAFTHVSQADFSGTPTTGTAPFEVAFSGTSGNDPVSWAWDFGDGETGTGQNPLHRYQRAGTYAVTLTATGSGAASVTKSDYITVDACGNLPARISGPVPKASLQAAYTGADTIDTIEVQAVDFPSLNMDLGKTITLTGGYDCNYSAARLPYTGINGTLTITSGLVTVDEIVIQ